MPPRKSSVNLRPKNAPELYQLLKSGKPCEVPTAAVYETMNWLRSLDAPLQVNAKLSKKGFCVINLSSPKEPASALANFDSSDWRR